MKKIVLNGDDIIIPEIVTKQDYTQNRLKYDSRYNVKELYNKFFLIDKSVKSKIIFPSYLFIIKEALGIKTGVVVIADFKADKTILLFGTLDNPLDTKSLLKVEYEKDKFYDNNILTFTNWINFFVHKDSRVFVITNKMKDFEELLVSQELNNSLKFKYLHDEDLVKVHSKIKPYYIRGDLMSMYLPAFLIAIIAFIFIGFLADETIKADIRTSNVKKDEKRKELSEITKNLKLAENSEYYKNKEYYKKLSERKVYTRDIKW